MTRKSEQKKTQKSKQIEKINKAWHNTPTEWTKKKMQKFIEIQFDKLNSCKSNLFVEML